MPRLTSPTGVIVSVSEEKAERLLSSGYLPAPDEQRPEAPVNLTPKRRPKTPARKTSEED